jgi:uncharacterized protein with GYD domain
MGIYILLTRPSPDALHQPKSFETLERHVADRVREHCPDVRWLANYALLGPWDYLDIVEAPDTEAAMRLAVLVRSHGHATTELWPAVEWPRFKRLLQGLPVRT